jgi:hypothetical protein
LKYYLKIAGEYFRYFEGRHLYPSLGNYRFWLWFIALGVWVYSLFHFATSGYASREVSVLSPILLPEIVWLGITFWIRAWKVRQIIETTNKTFTSKFQSIEECRLHMLRLVVAKEPSKFLVVAKEIDDLVSLERKFRKHSDLTWAEFARSIYDSDSKARLLTLAIVLVSTTIALAVRSEATLDVMFDLFTEPAGQNFLSLLAFIGIMIFFGLIGLRVFVFTVIEVLASWSIKLVGETMSPGWLLSYLVRDLVTHHGSDAAIDEASAESATTDNLEAPVKASNVAGIDFVRHAS